MRDLFKNHRHFWILTLANGISQIGDRFGHMALIALLAERYPGSFGVFGGLGVVLALPVIILAPMAGLIVDRYERRLILLGADLFRIVLLLAFAIITWLKLSLSLLYGFTFLWVGFTVLFNIAKGAYLPELVQPPQLLAANSLNAIVVRVATLVGAVGGGILVDRLGAGKSFFSNSLTYGTSFLLILLLPRAFPIHPHRARSLQPSFSQRMGMRQILELIRRGRVAYAGAAGFFAASGVALGVLVPYLQQILGGGTTAVGLAGGLLALGIGLGTVVMGGWPMKWVPYTIRGSLLVLGISLIEIPFVKHLSVFYGGSFLIGMSMAPLLVGVDTLLQRRFSPAERGRAFALKETLGAILVVLMSGLTGWGADRWGIPHVLWGSAGFLGLLALIPDKSTPDESG